MNLLTSNVKFLIFTLVAGFCCMAQTQRPGKVVDSLNRIAFDYPEEVIKASDSLFLIYKDARNINNYAYLLQVKGVALTSLGVNDEALKHHIKSYHIFDSVKNNNGKIFALCNIANVHQNMSNYKKGREYLLKALAITDKKDYNNLKNLYVNLGSVSQDIPHKAINYYRIAIPYLEKTNDYNGLAINYYNLGESSKELGNYADAEMYFKKALHFQHLSGSKSTLAMISLALGYIYTHNGRYNEAFNYLETGGKAAQEVESPYYKEIYYEYMAGWYKAKGDYKKQSVWMEQLLFLRESINSEQIMEANAMQEARFQTSLKNKEIQLLKAQKELDASAIQRNRIGWVVFCVISVLCFVIIFVLYRNYKLKQKANLLLGSQMTELEEQNLRLENENILVQFETLKNQVSPHFLFNSLNALASLIKANPDKALEFTGVFSKIFRNTLELKERHLISLEEELQQVNSYLYLQKMRFDDSLEVIIDITAGSLKKYIPPFSLQMVVENAIKHNIITKSEPLRISVKDDGDMLVIANNLQPRKYVEDSTGTGIKNIISRYRYLNAQQPVFKALEKEYIVQLPLIFPE